MMARRSRWTWNIEHTEGRLVSMGMKLNDYKPHRTIVHQESNFISRIRCGEMCRDSSTESPFERTVAGNRISGRHDRFRRFT